MARGRDGFMLLDVLLALLVLSLLMLVALPMLSPGTSPSRLEAYAAEVAALIKSDRAAAAQKTATVGTRIDVGRRRIMAGARSRAIDLPPDLAIDVTTNQLCGTDQGSIVIAFQADGRSCGAVIVLAKGGLAWRIRVNWLTGFVDVAGPA